MFKDVGKQIKTFATILFWLSIVGFVIAGLTFLGAGNLFGIFFLLAGPILACVSNMFLYGFGELIDKTASIERKLNSGAYDSHKGVKQEPVSKEENGNSSAE